MRRTGDVDRDHPEHPNAILCDEWGLAESVAAADERPGPTVRADYCGDRDVRPG